MLRPRVPRTDEFSGKAIDIRKPLSTKLADGAYLFVVDESGSTWTTPIAPRTKHNSLVLAGEKVRAAGEISVHNGVVNVNARSGHFYASEPLLGDEIKAFERHMRAQIQQAGLRAGEMSSKHVD